MALRFYDHSSKSLCPFGKLQNVRLREHAGHAQSPVYVLEELGGKLRPIIGQQPILTDHKIVSN